MSTISPEWKLAKFSLPSNAFYGNNNNVKQPNALTSHRTVFTQSSSRTIVEETFLKQFGPQKRRDSTNSLKVSDNKKIMNVSRKRSSSVNKSPDKVKPKKRRSISKSPNEKEEMKIEKRHRSVSPDWINSRFSLPSSPRTPKITSPNKKTPSPPKKRRSSIRSTSPDWETSRFSLPAVKIVKTPVQSSTTLKRISYVSPRITVPLLPKSKHMKYRISQKTLDKLLPKPEIHLFDIVKYGPAPQHKDDFLFGLNLMRSEVLNKIDLLHYKKKLRNTGMNFIRTFQQNKKTKSKRRKSNVAGEASKQIKEQESITIPDQQEEIEIDDVSDRPEEIILIDDNTEKEEIQDFADLFGSEVVEETAEKSNVIESDIDNTLLSNVNVNGENVKISETDTLNDSLTKNSNNPRNSLDSKTELLANAQNIKAKRNSLPDMKNVKKNGISKKKISPIKKKNIIKIKWPIARKSLLDLRNNS